MFLERKAKRNQEAGWIEVVCGSMFSGKTEELLRRLKRAQIAQQSVVIFKPKVDNRYSEDQVVSHDENAVESTVVDSAEEILLHANDIDVVGIDEGQFFDEGIVDVCNKLANSGSRVIVAGLDMDFSGRPFGPMPYLMAIAEYVTKVHAICVDTGQLANYSYRLVDDSDQVLVGEKESYIPLSRKAFNARIKRAKEQKS